jgi:hypothetical protein
VRKRVLCAGGARLSTLMDTWGGCARMFATRNRDGDMGDRILRCDLAIDVVTLPSLCVF